jgi:hypothetical protein
MSDAMGTQLVRYDAMCRAIAEAHAVDEVKDIRDKAIALEYYARQARTTEAERKACEIRLRAERKVGRLTSEMETAQGERTDTTSSHRATKLRALQDAGISKDQASKWERLAAIPDDEFEAALASPEMPSTSGILAAHTPPKQQHMDDRALWVWGRLLDFERQRILETDPRDLFGQMFEHMQETTRELAPRVAEWLGRITSNER